MKIRVYRLKRALAFILTVGLLISPLESYGLETVDVSGNDGFIECASYDVTGGECPEDNYDDISSTDYIGENILMNDISAGDISLKDYSAAKEKAVSSFRDLISRKNLMAVIYPYEAKAYCKPDSESEIVSPVPVGYTIYVEDIEIDDLLNVWYKAAFYIDFEQKTGYFEPSYLLYTDEDWISWQNKELSDLLTEAGVLFKANSFAASTDDVANFPVSYRGKLSDLKSQHPNWYFVPDNTGLDFNAAVDAEVGDKSWIQATTFNQNMGFVGSPTGQSGWYYATRAGVLFYMDPRNWLFDHNPDDNLPDGTIFMFEQLTYNSSYHTKDSVQQVISSTFMSGQIPRDSRTYSQAFYEIGKSMSVSPVHLASRVMLEQGEGTSPLISGAYPGYEGYFNYFNVGASGSSKADVIKNGLKYAKEHGWNTRYGSLKGGAKVISDAYIRRGQDTIYYEKFNVSPGAESVTYSHQYQQNVQAPMRESSSTQASYKSCNIMNSAFVFKIPVYTNMPGEKINFKLSGATSKLRIPGRESTDTTGFSKADLAANTSEVQLSLSKSPSDYFKNAKYEYKSSDNKVATVSSKGKVTAVGVGEATITVKVTEGGSEVKGLTATYKVSVSIPIEDVTLNDYEITIRRPNAVADVTENLNEKDISENVAEYDLLAMVSPSDTSDKKTITWKSSNTKVATVDKNGHVKAVAIGTAKITATASGSSMSTDPVATCKVTVTAPVSSISLKNPAGKTNLVVGDHIRLVPEYLPKDATGEINASWASSDEAVLKVTDEGTVYATGKGEADITATIYRYSVTLHFTVRIPKLRFYDVSGEHELMTYDVRFGENVPADIIEEVTDYYEVNAEDNEFFAGLYTLPEGKGILFTKDSIISSEDTKLYPYYQSRECDFYVIPPGSYEYTGSAIKPNVEVYGVYSTVSGNEIVRETRLLTYKKEYTLSYSNNTKINTNPKKRPTVTVKGTGNFSGTQKVYFDIVPVEINSGNVKVNDVKVAYSGKTIKSSFTVYKDGRKLRKGTDYVISYPSTVKGAYINEGSWPVLISGKGGYSGLLTVNEIITKEVFLSKVTISSIPDQTFALGGNTPKLTVKYGKKGLEEGVHYSVSYTNNTKIGTATATITAIEGSGYTGTKSKSFKIKGISLSKVKIVDVSGNNPIKTKVYTGNEEDVHQHGYILTYKGVPLKESVDGTNGDYVVSYSKADRVGTAQIVFKGINGYCDTVKKKYKITQRLISDAFTPTNDVSYNYLKGGTKPLIDVYDGDKLLVRNKDYTITWANYSTVTTPATKKLPTYTIAGKGNYKGKVVGYYHVIDGDFENSDKISITVSDLGYQKKAGVFRAKPVVKDSDGKTLTANKDYKIVSYTYADDVTVNDKKGNPIFREAGSEIDNKKDILCAGTKVKVTLSGCGKYAGDGSTVREVTYRIYSINLSKVSVKVLHNKTYDYGRAVTISGEDLRVTYKGETLTEGIDYYIDTSTYSKNTSKGTASVTIRACRDNPGYGGNRKISFKIVARIFSFLFT